MKWLTLIAAILKAVVQFTIMLGNRQLIEAGQAKAISEGLALTLANMEKANEAAAAVDSSNPNYDADYANRVRNRFERKPGE